MYYVIARVEVLIATPHEKHVESVEDRVECSEKEPTPPGPAPRRRRGGGGAGGGVRVRLRQFERSRLRGERGLSGLFYLFTYRF